MSSSASSRKLPLPPCRISLRKRCSSLPYRQPRPADWGRRAFLPGEIQPLQRQHVRLTNRHTGSGPRNRRVFALGERYGSPAVALRVPAVSRVWPHRVPLSWPLRMASTQDYRGEASKPNGTCYRKLMRFFTSQRLEIQ